MLHVLTGYGRDSLGEACVLAFTYSQQASPAHLFIGYMAGLNVGKQVGGGAPVLRAIREAQRAGEGLPAHCGNGDHRTAADVQLDDVRRKLNITPAMRYRAAHAVRGSMGGQSLRSAGAEEGGLI